ncbi:probable pre-mRNA-splicing factor ATP-dependent RNA helicase DEAH5, partial [Tanacetum coccineum]
MIPCEKLRICSPGRRKKLRRSWPKPEKPQSWGRGKGNPAEEYGKKAFITNSSHEVSIATDGATDMLYVYYLRAYILELMSWSCRDGVSRKTDELELCPVYSGRVTRRMHDTCFVDILDVKGKAGSVHVSRIMLRRVASAKDMVKRDQEVFVKVILVSNRKFSLSIRDVDQNTGKDLLSMKKIGEDGDGGHVNVGPGVDNSNNKSWIM